MLSISFFYACTNFVILVRLIGKVGIYNIFLSIISYSFESLLFQRTLTFLIPVSLEAELLIVIIPMFYIGCILMKSCSSFQICVVAKLLTTTILTEGSKIS